MPNQGPAPISDPVITLDRVRKQFGSFVAVENADFSIARAEFFALLGPSGCGKTTTLRMIAGFEQPTSGRVLLEGKDVSNVAPYRRNVNTVFQQYALFPHLSVYDNVAFGLRSKKVPSGDIAKRVMDMLEIVRLGEFVKRKPNQLSGGQQQRVALARALVNLPSALLLDEPLAALDLKLREAMQIELKRIQREVGITFVFVTHDQGEALTMSDRIAVMSQGRVEQIATPEQIYGTPASVFVAGFIGSANLMPGIVVGREGSDSVIELTSGAKLRATGRSDLVVGTRATVMLRPERLDPVATEPTDRPSLRGTTSDVIFQGASARVIVDLADGTEVVAIVDSDAQLPFLRPGDPLWLTWEPDAPFALEGWPAHAGATTTDVDHVEATMEGTTATTGASAVTEPAATGLGRRRLIGGAVAAGIAAVTIGIVKALGSDDSSDGAAGAPATTGPAAGGPAAGAAAGDSLVILNWPLYIENDDATTSPTISGFTERTGIKVDYRPEIDGNDTFYTKYEPLLAKGKGIGADLVVLTSWMAARMVEKGFVQPLDAAVVPNKANLLPRLQNPSWDPGRTYSLPWAIGMTGIAYWPDKVGGTITSISDLLDPKLKNRVSLLDEKADTIGLFMLDMGFDPTTGTIDQALQALARIKQARDGGQFRKIAGNSYVEDLQLKETWAAIAWSGDIASLKKDAPGIEFLLPAKGAMSFVDNCLIPIGADNPVGATEFLNHVYDPTIAGPLYESIVYVPPVAGAEQYMTAAGRADPFVVPPADAKLHEFRILTEAEDGQLDEAFAQATQL